MEINALSVKQLNFYVRSLIEGDVRLNNLTVTGELSNLKNHYQSGHLYFTLKDSDAAIRCVMFRTFAQKVNFELCDGMQVVIRGRVSLYEKDGQYQLYAEEMHTAGFGDIALKFEQIKKRLENEGMFDAENKRPVPKFPKNIAVVTSPTGAAVQDILNILSRRWPLANVIMCPVSVQGELAVPEMCKALDKLYSLSVADVIIIGRGGGSIEDLWAFNSEELARKIYESPIPVISAVGHETDFTICDFVSDLRAPTPSAAAELSVPDINEFIAKIDKYSDYLVNALKNKYILSKTKLEKIENSSIFKKPKDCFINRNNELIDRLYDSLLDSVSSIVEKNSIRLNEKILCLDNLSPLKTLSRGFASVTKDSEPVKSVKDIKTGDNLDFKLSDGILSCYVNEIKLRGDGSVR